MAEFYVIFTRKCQNSSWHLPEKYFSRNLGARVPPHPRLLRLSLGLRVCLNLSVSKPNHRCNVDHYSSCAMLHLWSTVTINEQRTMVSNQLTTLTLQWTARKCPLGLHNIYSSLMTGTRRQHCTTNPPPPYDKNPSTCLNSKFRTAFSSSDSDSRVYTFKVCLRRKMS